jgi:eight-cysteine-cluster-containing protein
MNKKFILIIAVIAIFVFVGAGIYFWLNQKSPRLSHNITNFEECARAGFPVGESHPRQCWTADGRHFVESIEETPPPASGEITIAGEITCLPKIGQREQTMECAMGMKGDDGRYYGLKNLATIDPEDKFSTGGVQVEVSGMFSPEELKGPDGNKYDIVGVIDVVSAKEIARVSDDRCKVTGCSGQICSDQDVDQDVITTCEWREEYACYRFARCERQSDNTCGWTMTEEAKKCLMK